MSVLLEAIGQLLLIGVLLIIKESPIMALFVLLPLAVVQTLTLSVVSKNKRYYDETLPYIYNSLLAVHFQRTVNQVVGN